MEILKRRKKKKKTSKAAASAVAAMTAAGVMVGGAMSSPDDAMNDGPEAIVQTIAVTPQIQADAGGGDSDAEEAVVVEEEKKKRGKASSVRKALAEAPFSQRVKIAVPLWIAGTVAIAFLSSLWMSVLPPLAAAALSWVFTLVMAVLVFVMAAKTVFPDMPLKKILNKRTFLGIGILCLLFGIADAALPFFWDDYTKLSVILKVLGSFTCTGVPLAYFMRRHKRDGAGADRRGRARGGSAAPGTHHGGEGGRRPRPRGGAGRQRLPPHVLKKGLSQNSVSF